MKTCPAWLTKLSKSSIEEAIEAVGRECKPSQVIVFGRPSWGVFDALVGIPSVRCVETYTNYPDPSKVITGWKDVGDVILYPITRPSRAFTLNPKIVWIDPTGEGWSRSCDLAVLCDRNFPFDKQSAENIGSFVHRMAADAFVSVGRWEHDFPPRDFHTVELNGGHCGFHPVRVPNKKKAIFARYAFTDHAALRMGQHREKAQP